MLAKAASVIRFQNIVCFLLQGHAGTPGGFSQPGCESFLDIKHLYIKESEPDEKSSQRWAGRRGASALAGALQSP
jgi:hypothetical protein